MLTTEQKSDLVRDGFVQVRAAIAPEMTARALQAIYHRIGQGIDKEDLATFQSRSFFPELAQSPLICDLFNASGLRETMGDLIGMENVSPQSKGQLALRFPRAPGTLAAPPHPHIDGLHTPTNGVPAGTLGSFTALVGVFLSDVAQDFAGNFTVWPQSHRKMEAHFRESGIAQLLDGQTPTIEGGEALQIKARAGDVVIAHYQLLHAVAMNLAPLPRCAVFFRVKHPQHETHRLECLTDLWREWPGVAGRVAIAAR